MGIELILALIPLIPKIVQGISDLVQSGQMTEEEATAALDALSAKLDETRAKVMAYKPLPPSQ